MTRRGKALNIWKSLKTDITQRHFISSADFRIVQQTLKSNYDNAVFVYLACCFSSFCCRSKQTGNLFMKFLKTFFSLSFGFEEHFKCFLLSPLMDAWKDKKKVMILLFPTQAFFHFVLVFGRTYLQIHHKTW